MENETSIDRNVRLFQLGVGVDPQFNGIHE